MRIFVEWFDPSRPNWGGYLVSTSVNDFQAELEESVGWWGPPTLVEFRAEGKKKN